MYEMVPKVGKGAVVKRGSIKLLDAAGPDELLTYDKLVKEFGLLAPMSTDQTDIIRLSEEEKYSINYDGHVSKMGELRDLAKDNKQFSSAIRAEELRGRLQGYYIEQKAVLHKKVTAEDAKKNINKYEDIIKARKITSKLIKD